MIYNQTCQKLSRLTASQSVELDSLILLEMITGLNRSEIIGNRHLKLSRRQCLNLDELIRARQKQPIAYITGFREFFSINFIVNDQVLIPRPESESLVEIGLQFCRNQRFVYDVGAGSGCLGISYCLNSQFDQQLTMVDIEPVALKVSRQNCQRQKVKAQFKLADLTKLKPDFFQPNSLIFANLPYLDVKLKADFIKKCPDLAAEPELALFTESGGLNLYRQLFNKLQSVKNSQVIIESQPSQVNDLIKIGRKANFTLNEKKGLGLLFSN